MPLMDTPIMLLLLWAVIGYLLGSIPFGIVVTQRLKLGNLREIGSGNIGATNVLRTGNKGAAAATRACRFDMFGVKCVARVEVLLSPTRRELDCPYEWRSGIVIRLGEVCRSVIFWWHYGA